ncbi:hypothetical protein COY87_01840 [Candidatus Roizmanbacteria bacterium CG_4_10_14_0_8_um_filter_33_9]|uniref:F0F1 ATP synthase subunit n=1 Tax=Candidatus Roizmanbacteria bacterium CG_4_10_14_0_8_um_filter_33_9 TaxID=1974826 RepID=A0A2M7QK04_9BACT|nr:MAG: hypothetical protein COY87_01840 [Candidatus Roizmanbacteria bacterium CG_4_10_14_0_8_um_filter_33_9]
MVKYKRKIIKTIIDKDLNLKERIELKKGIKKVKTGSYQYLNIGFYLITPLLIGIFSGLYLDNKFGKKPLFVLMGIVIGVLSTFYNLYRLTKIK